MKDKNRNEMLFDALMKISISDAFEKEMDALPTDEELNEAYKPSAELDKRIRRLISQNRRSSVWKSFIKSAGRAAACVAIIFTVLSITLLSVSATRNAIFNAVVEWTEKYTKIQFNDSVNTGVHSPSYLPEGFSQKDIKKAGSTVMLTYTNERDVTILFKQRPAEAGTSLFDNENTNYKEIDISGKPAYLFEGRSDDDNNVLIWQSEGMVFELTSEIDSKELIQIGKSLKLAGR